MVTSATLAQLILGPPATEADVAPPACTPEPAAAPEPVTVPAPASAPASTPARREPLPADLIADIAAGVAQVPAAWSDLVCHDPDERRPVRLMATEAYEVWVIGWTKGQHVRPHDHGGSAAAVLVTEGELTEITLMGQRHQLEAGSVHRLGPGVVHDVVNTSDVPATSIHVYSPPLSTMTYYDPVTWEPDETVQLEHATPVLSTWHGARLLHPARPRTEPLASAS
jgi:quercetin dioxygenase-like cupin family protein